MTPADTDAYPLIPQHSDKSIIKPSASFKKRVVGMVAAIVLFIITYILLLVSTLAIATCFFLFAYFLVFEAHFYWLTFVFSVALVASGLLLIFFLIKFLFKFPGKTPPAFMEVTADSQPKLFAFIKKVTQEVGVPFPKHVYLDCDVNASVFYNSNFWSMFLPVPKNLRIGLGLINSLNQSEFKAVLAHEFGHFSQRSMKFGSYVYNLNKIIYNMLYDNDGYTRILDAWSNSYSYFRITSYINVHLIRGIQSILRQVYTVVNKTHMRLSREMEFQADAISAYTAGSNQAINCLRRTEVGSNCYNEILNYWSNKLETKQRTDNFYANHIEVMRCFAEQNYLDTDGVGLPVIHKQLAVLNNVQLYVHNQWASHPQLHEREHKLAGLHLNTDTITTSAWMLFNNFEELQISATNFQYSQYGDVSKFAIINNSDFATDYRAQAFEYSNDNYYRGYYNNRKINIKDTEPEKPDFELNEFVLSRLLDEENTNLPKRAEGIQRDIILLTYAKGDKDIITFDYKGIKYEMKQADIILERMNVELVDTEAKITALDQLIYTCIYHFTDNAGKLNLRNLYLNLDSKQQAANQIYELYDKLGAAIQPVYTTMKYADIEETLKQVELIEKDLKKALNSMLGNDELINYIKDDERQSIDQYLEKDMKYFDGHNYLN